MRYIRIASCVLFIVKCVLSLFRFDYVLLVQRSVKNIPIEIKKALAVKQVLFVDNRILFFIVVGFVVFCIERRSVCA